MKKAFLPAAIAPVAVVHPVVVRPAKKIRLFFAAALLVLAIGAKAQSADSTRTPEGRATALTEKMKTQLSLNDDQVPLIQTINLKYAQKNREIWTGTGGRFAKFKALKSSQKDKDKEIKAVLNKDQYKKYKVMQEEMKDKAKAEYKGRQGT